MSIGISLSIVVTCPFLVYAKLHSPRKKNPFFPDPRIYGFHQSSTFVGSLSPPMKVLQLSGAWSLSFSGKRSPCFKSFCSGCLRLLSTSTRPAEGQQCSSTVQTKKENPAIVKVHAIIIPESEWRKQVDIHSQTVKSLLSPGLLSPSGDESLLCNHKSTGNEKKQKRQPVWKNKEGGVRGLDPKHPIYNFLIEYYGLKGSKGVRRLMRWCPEPCYMSSGTAGDDSLASLEIAFHDASEGHFPVGRSDIPSVSGVVLENANLDDVVDGVLHMRGATFLSDASYRQSTMPNDGTINCKSFVANEISGVLYCPALYFASKDPRVLPSPKDRNQRLPKSAAAFLWYRSLLRNTVRSEPILYCHGMHEWAMLYRPTPDSPPPPSSQYQSHLPLRVSQTTINEQVERKGVRCTHIDALRFFAPEARKWNHFGRLEDATDEARDDFDGFDLGEDGMCGKDATLTREDQLRLEQKACLHANMDLFKMALRLQPFISSELLIEALSVALRARTLDVEASPYDVSGYEGLAWGDAVGGELRIAKETRQLGAVEVETEEGRKVYQQRQIEVMKEGEIVRKKLLDAYNALLENVFGIDENIDIDKPIINR